MTSKVTIIEQWEELFLVRVGHDFHVIHFDADQGVIKSVYSGDRINKVYLQANEFSSEAIRAITKGRKRETATAYFNQLRRTRQRSGPSDGSLSYIK